MKITLCQINPTPRDIEGNCRQIKDGIDAAVAAGSDCAVFPELCIPGYGVKDCIYDKQFINKNLVALQDIILSTRGKKIYVVLGYIDYNRAGVGKPFYNCAAVLHNGVVVGVHHKQLLPFYDVFDEGRYYEPGNDLLVWEMGGQKFSALICEENWNDKGQDDYKYADNPLARCRALGINNIISINASPFVVGKPRRRHEMFRKITRNSEMTIVYVNQIGGQDELVFDGNSFIARDGKIVFSVEENAEPTYSTFDTDDYVIVNGDRKVSIYTSPNKDIRDLHDMILMGTRDYLRKSGFKKVVFGSSGGIDSAVVAYFACQAVWPENVYGVRMPSIYSTQGSKDDAEQLHKNLGCHDAIINVAHEEMLNHINRNFKFSVGEVRKSLPYNEVAEENVQARLRGMYLMHLSNAYGMLVLTTGNKSELALGYFTLYGDACGGFAPIGDCYKTEVYALARYINEKAGKEIIPRNIIDKAPSAELKPNQQDIDSLLPYPLLDPIIEAYVEDYVTTFDDFVTWERKQHPQLKLEPIGEWLSNKDAEMDYLRMVRKIDRVEFKRRQLAPNVKVHRVAFGSGRRLPIVKGD